MKLLDRLDAFWFDAAPAERLAALRILAGGFALHVSLFQRSRWLELPNVLPEFWAPVGVATLLPEPLAAGGVQALLIACDLLGVAFVLGAGFRVTGPLFAIATLFLHTYAQSFSMIHHSWNLLVLQVLVLGFAPGTADAWSLDARRRGEPAGEHARYGWPIRLMCAATVATYFLAGVSKLMGGAGLAWATGEVLRDQILVDALRKDVLGSEVSDWAFSTVDSTGVLFPLAVGALVLELGAPLALLHRRAGWVFGVATLGLHWGIKAVMDITFRYQLSGLAFACFYPVEKPVLWLRDRLRG